MLKILEILCKSKLLLKIINNIACVCVGGREREREKDELYAHVLRYFKLACHFKIVFPKLKKKLRSINEKQTKSVLFCGNLCSQE